MDELNKTIETAKVDIEGISKFTESYASFNRIINSLQRKYIELQEEFTSQNEKLAEANKQLVALSQKSINTTEFLNGVLSSTPAGVIAVDRNGEIIHFNPAASVILGINGDESIGKHYRDVVPPGEPKDANALRTAESGREVVSEEKKITLPDDRVAQVSVSTAVIKGNDDFPIGAVEVFQDLTKFKKMENEIARLNTLAALGEMAATIAHEVRNPLSGIGGFAALLDRDISEDDPKKQLVKKIDKGVKNLNATIETLLNYTRFEEINKSDVEMAEFISNTISQFKNDNPDRIEKINFVLAEPSDPSHNRIVLRIDKLLFRQIFFNIYANSLDALDGEGQIKTEFKVLPRREAAEKYADRLIMGLDETIFEITISDTGHGIEEEALEKIFAPFYTKKPEGNGLGLAVAWKILKTHGGDIFAENLADNEGAAFHILMPMPIDLEQGEK